MPKYYNNSDLYGDAGPFEAESKGALADEMASSFEKWAREAYYQAIELTEGVDREAFLDSEQRRLRAEFIDGLEEIA